MSRIEISKRIVLINTASSAVALILNLSVLIWLQQYLLKRISPEEYSLVPIVMSIMAFAPLVTMVLTQGVGRYITIAYAKGDDEEVSRICSTMFPILVFAGLVLLGLGWLAAWHIDQLLDIAPEYVDDAQIMMALLVFSASLRVIFSLFGSGFIVKQKLMLQDLIDIGCQFLRIAVLFALLFGVSTQVLWVVVAMVVAEVTNIVISTIVSLRIFPEQRAIHLGHFRSYVAKEITSYGGWGFVQNVADTIKQSFDPIILNKFATAVDVSVFYVGGIAARQLRLMLVPFARPFLPILAALYATKDYSKLRNTYLRATRYHLWIILFVAVPAIIFSDEVMYLYLDGKYDQAGNIMAILLLVTVLNTFNSMGPAVVMAAGKVKEMSLRFLLIQSVNIILTVLLVVFLQQGASGSAVATLLTVVFLETTFMWPFCRKVAHTTTTLWVKEVVMPSLGSAIPSIVVCLFFQYIQFTSTWTEIVLVSALSMMLNLAVIMFYGLRHQDRIDMGRLAIRLKGPVKVIVEYFVK